jgi:hypothetical protein
VPFSKIPVIVRSPAALVTTDDIGDAPLDVLKPPFTGVAVSIPVADTAAAHIADGAAANAMDTV